MSGFLKPLLNHGDNHGDSPFGKRGIIGYLKRIGVDNAKSEKIEK